MKIKRGSIAAKDPLALGFDAFELAAPHGPRERAEDQEAEDDGEGDEEEEDVHLRRGLSVEGWAGLFRWTLNAQRGTGRRASRAAFSTTNSELAAMPSPASHGGIHPAIASGTHTAL